MDNKTAKTRTSKKEVKETLKYYFKLIADVERCISFCERLVDVFIEKVKPLVDTLIDIWRDGDF